MRQSGAFSNSAELSNVFERALYLHVERCGRQVIPASDCRGGFGHWSKSEPSPAAGPLYGAIEPGAKARASRFGSALSFYAVDLLRHAANEQALLGLARAVDFRLGKPRSGCIAGEGIPLLH